MDSFLLLKPLLKKISDGSFFKLIYSWFFRISACLVIVFILWSSWKLWKNLPGNLPAKYFIIVIVSELFLLLGGFIAFNILWIRAENIQKLPVVKDYSVTPIMVISIRASGEIGASLFILSGAIISISSWFEIYDITRMMPFSISLPYISGNYAFIIGFIFGFLVLISSYFFGEQVGALVDIARNTSKKR